MYNLDFLRLSPTARSFLFIQLTPFPNYYLVLIVKDDRLEYSLISASLVPDSMYQTLRMQDIGNLDVAKICRQTQHASAPDAEDVGALHMGAERTPSMSNFRVETQVLRELYAYCWYVTVRGVKAAYFTDIIWRLSARVAHTKVENQFKARGIPYQHILTAPKDPSDLPPSLNHLHSALSHRIPFLCVQASNILKNSPAVEAAMPNIRVIPLSWWSTSESNESSSSSSLSWGNEKAIADRPPQVVMCVKLKYVQQPVGRRAGLGKGVIRPSKRIVYDATEAVVCFLADEVEGCVNEFLEEWAKVSKIVVIAREGQSNLLGVNIE